MMKHPPRPGRPPIKVEVTTPQPVVNVTPQAPALSRREEVWTRAWASVAAAITCKDIHVATNWADHCLVAFDNRFGK